MIHSLKDFFVRSSPSTAHASILIIRIMVGGIFIFAGLRKFLEPENMGAGRFAEMGFPFPGFLGPWVGGWEIIGGFLVLTGLLTRAGAIPLIVTMIVALLTTKVPNFQADGLVAGLHAMRLDTALLLGSVYLLFAGGGRYALDSFLRKDHRLKTSEKNESE